MGFVRKLCAVAFGLFAFAAQPRALAEDVPGNVAKIGTQEYATFAEAVDAANAVSSDDPAPVIEILQDFEKIILEADLGKPKYTLKRSMTIDLKGHRIAWRRQVQNPDDWQQCEAIYRNVVFMKITGAGTDVRVIGKAGEGHGVGSIVGQIAIDAGTESSSKNTLTLDGGTYGTLLNCKKEEKPNAGNYIPVRSYPGEGEGTCDIVARDAEFKTGRFLQGKDVPGMGADYDEVYVSASFWLEAKGKLDLTDCEFTSGRAIWNKAAAVTIRGGSIAENMMLEDYSGITLDSTGLTQPTMSLAIVPSEKGPTAINMTAKEEYMIHEYGGSGTATGIDFIEITAGTFTTFRGTPIPRKAISLSEAYLNSGRAKGISGGTFSTAPDARLIADGCEAKPVPDASNPTHWEVTGPVAQIVGGGQYTTLQAAVDAAASGATIQILKGIELAEPVEIKTDLTIDLNGQAITYGGGKYALFLPQNSAIVTINDSSTGADGSISASGMGHAIQVQSGAWVYLKAGAIESATGIAISGQYGNFRISGGRVFASDADAIASDWCDLQVNGGEIQSGNGYAIKFIRLPSSPVISGGTFSGTLGALAIPVAFKGPGSVTGGTYSSDIAELNNGALLAEGYESKENAGQSTWTVAKKAVVVEYVARIGDTQYATLQAAVDAAASGATIQILKAITLSASVTISKSLTIDLNGQAITTEDGVTALEISGAETAVTINDPVTGGSIKATGAGHAINAADASVTISAGAFSSTGAAAINLDAESAGKLAISGGTFTGTPAALAISGSFAGPGHITGGTYSSQPPAELIAAAHEARQNGGESTWTVVPVVDNPAAKIGEVKYATLQAAVAAAVANPLENRTVDLLRGIELEEKVRINGSLTLNLNGFTISKPASGDTSIEIFQSSGKALDEAPVPMTTINGAASEGDAPGHGVGAIVGAIDCGPNSASKNALTLNGGKYGDENASYIAVRMVGALSVLNGATIASSTTNAVFVPVGSSFRLNGGTIKSVKSDAINATNATIAIEAGEVISTGAAAIRCDLNSAKVLAIKGGTFTGAKVALDVPADLTTIAEGGIQGGTYSSKPPAELITHGYVAKENTSATTWAVVEDEPVARIVETTTDYKTLKAAVEAANAIDSSKTVTIRILRNFELMNQKQNKPIVTISRSMDIELDGHTIGARIPGDQYYTALVFMKITGDGTIVRINGRKPAEDGRPGSILGQIMLEAAKSAPGANKLLLDGGVYGTLVTQPNKPQGDANGIGYAPIRTSSGEGKGTCDVRAENVTFMRCYYPVDSASIVLDAKGTLDLTDCNFTCGAAVLNKAASVAIHGGSISDVAQFKNGNSAIKLDSRGASGPVMSLTIDKSQRGYPTICDGDYAIQEIDGTTASGIDSIVIKGGTFIGASGALSLSDAYLSDGNTHGISGGRFSSDPAALNAGALIADGYKSVEEETEPGDAPWAVVAKTDGLKVRQEIPVNEVLTDDEVKVRFIIENTGDFPFEGTAQIRLGETSPAGALALTNFTYGVATSVPGGYDVVVSVPASGSVTVEATAKASKAGDYMFTTSIGDISADPATLKVVDAVAKIGNTKYAILAEAIAAVNAATGAQVIDILRNCFGPSTTAATYVKNDCTINLDGHVITGKDKERRWVLRVIDGHKVTIDGTKEGSKIVGNMLVGSNAKNQAVHGVTNTIVFNGGTYEQPVTEQVVQSNGADPNFSRIVATNATFASGKDAFYLPGKGAIELQNCKVSGQTCIRTSSAEVTIVDSTLTATGTRFSGNPFANMDRRTGSAIVFETSGTSAGDMKLNISGARTAITSANGYAIEEFTPATGSSRLTAIAITDGKFIGALGAISASDPYLATGKAGAVSGGRYSSEPDARLIVEGFKAQEVETDPTDAPWAIVKKDVKIVITQSIPEWANIGTQVPVSFMVSNGGADAFKGIVKIRISGTTPDGAPLVLEGFNVDPASSVAGAYDVTVSVPANNSMTVTAGTEAAPAGSYTFTTTVGDLSTAPATLDVSAPVAQIGSTMYGTFTAAIKAANAAAEPVVIDLLTDCDADPVAVSVTKSCTLNLNGHTLKGTQESHSLILRVIEGSTLTINGDETSKVIGCMLVGTKYQTKENSIVINGGTYEQDKPKALFQSNGLDTSKTHIIATDATFIGSDKNNAFYLPGDGSLELTRCKVSGATAIYSKSASIKLVDSEITANGPWAERTANTNGGDPTGSAIMLDTNPAYEGTTALTISGTTKVVSANGYAIQEYTDEGKTSALSTIAITDGTFQGVKGAIFTSAAYQAPGAISGGKFSSKIDDKLVVPGFTTSDTVDAEGFYTIVEKKFAKIAITQNVPATAFVGDAVAVSFTLANSGNAAFEGTAMIRFQGSNKGKKLTLAFDGVEATEWQPAQDFLGYDVVVNVAAGESVTIKATATATEAGEYKFKTLTDTECSSTATLKIEAKEPAGYAEGESITDDQGNTVALTAEQAAWLNDILGEGDKAAMDEILKNGDGDGYGLEAEYLLNSNPTVETKATLKFVSIVVGAEAKVTVTLTRTEKDAALESALNGTIAILSADAVDGVYAEAGCLDKGLAKGEWVDTVGAKKFFKAELK